MNLPEVPHPNVDRSFRRFAVAWRNRVKRSMHLVAALEYQSGSYRFQYVHDVHTSVDGFRPFIGFPHLGRVYESARLWPFFDLRVMDPRRPDFAQYVHWLGLTPDADRLDLLARTGGENKGDTVLLAQAPRIAADGATEATFLVRGSRYAVSVHKSQAEADRLEPHDVLTVVDDVGNEANPNALLLTSPTGDPFGWVPDLLIDYVRTVMTGGGTTSLLRNNGPDAPWHTRFVVRVQGTVAPGPAFFDSSVWSPLVRPVPLMIGEAHLDAAGERNGFDTSVGDARGLRASRTGLGLASGLEAGPHRL